MRTMVRAGSLAMCALALGAPAAAQAEWETYEAKRYGFSMLVPKGAKLVDRDREDGWGVLEGSFEGVKLYGCAQLGRHDSREAIEAFGVRVTGIAADRWEPIDKGKTRGRWTWYDTVLATEGDRAAVGIYGIGPRGSYLLVLVTTTEDYEEHEADYRRWYESITLHGGWELFRAKDYGFTMLVPEGCALKTREDGAWGALEGSHAGVTVYGLAKRGERAAAEEIEELGVELTGIGSDHWKHVDKGKNRRGWDWYETVVARDGDRACVGIYGVGKKGSFLLLLRTTASDYEAHQEAYDYWYRHVHLD